MSKISFKKCKTLAEIVCTAKKYKEDGADPMEVNRLASLRRQELVNAVDQVNMLDKLSVQASAIPKNRCTHIAICSVSNLNSPTLEILGDRSVRL